MACRSENPSLEYHPQTGFGTRPSDHWFTIDRLPLVIQMDETSDRLTICFVVLMVLLIWIGISTHHQPYVWLGIFGASVGIIEAWHGPFQ